MRIPDCVPVTELPLLDVLILSVFVPVFRVVEALVDAAVFVPVLDLTPEPCTVPVFLCPATGEALLE